MKGAPSVVALAAFAAALSGCGSGVSVPEHGLHSPSRQYSVRQVEAVFAAEGIPLRSVAPSVDAGSIAFLDGRPAHRVYVYVVISGKGGTHLEPFAGNETRRGNVTVLSGPGNAATIRAALDELS